MKIPSMLHQMKLHENGTEFVGTVDVVLPSFKLKTETKRFAGMSGPAEFTDGTLAEPLKMTVTATELRSVLLAGFVGKCQGLRTLNLRAIYKNPIDCAKGLHNIIATGYFTQVDLGTVKMGDDTQRKYEFTCHKFRYEVNATVVVDANMMDITDAADRKFLG